VIFNPLTAGSENAMGRDLDRRELAAMAVFAVAILWLGISPGGVLRRMEGPATRIVEQVTRGADLTPVEAAVAPLP
jgi:NADH:ubiquinone oxidoreductase subunit 4 (subunit M)